MARKKKDAEIVVTEEITENVEIKDNDDVCEDGSEAAGDQDKEEFLEDHELAAMEAVEDLGEQPAERCELAPLEIHGPKDGPWRRRCPFFIYENEQDAWAYLEIDCSFHGHISLQTACDSAEDVIAMTQGQCFGDFGSCETYKEIYEAMQGCDDPDPSGEYFKVCGNCCNASLDAEDLHNPDNDGASEYCHCLQSGCDRLRCMEARLVDGSGCPWFNRYLDWTLDMPAQGSRGESEVAVRGPIEVDEERTPDVIALEINAIKTATMKTVLVNLIAIGGKLTEAKELVGHGNWGGWLQEKVNYSQDTANNLMKLFREYGPSQLDLFGTSINSETFRNLGYSQALALCAIPADEREGFVQGNDVGKISIRQLKREVEEYKNKLDAAESKVRNLEWRTGDSWYRNNYNKLNNENYELKQKLREAGSPVSDSSGESDSIQKERVEVLPREAVNYIKERIENFFESIAPALPDKGAIKIFVDACKSGHYGYYDEESVIGTMDELVDNLKAIVGWIRELSPDCYEWAELGWCGYSSEESGSEEDGDE